MVEVGQVAQHILEEYVSVGWIVLADVLLGLVVENQLKQRLLSRRPA